MRQGIRIVWEREDKLMKSKKGFTLIELCIVIALIAIVSTMVVTFLAVYQKNSFSLVGSKAIMNDISDVRTTVKDWVQQYDNGEYEFNASGSTLEAKNSSGDVAKIYIAEKTLYRELNGEIINADKMTVITSSKFSFDTTQNDEGVTVEDRGVVKCTVYFGGSQEEMMFTLFSNSQRSRFSPEGR